MNQVKNEKSEAVKQHWESMSAAYGVDLKSTTKTLSIKKLEINALSQAINSIMAAQNSNVQNVLEVGCGNGYNCCFLSKAFPNLSFTGIDYVPDMIKNAKAFAELEDCRDIVYMVGDVLKLSAADLLSAYDIVFTDRCLINLDTIEKQKKAISNLAERVSANGYLILIENITQTYGNQNACRKLVGLEERTPAHYNLFMDDALIMECANETNLQLIDTHDFGSLHDLFLYVILPKINGGMIDYESQMVETITEFCIDTSDLTKNQFGQFGQNRLYLFRKVV